MGRYLLVAMTGMLPTLSATAREYSFDYSVEGSASFSDNLGLDTQNKSSAYGGRIDLPMTLRANGDRLRSALLTELSSAKYDDSGYDSDDQRFNASSDYLFERGSVGATLGLNRSSTRDTEFLDTGEIGGTATRVEYATASVRANRQFTPRQAVNLNANYREADYSSRRFNDNKSYSGSVSWLYRTSEKTQLRLLGSTGRFENESTFQTRASTTGLQAGFDTKFSENLNFSLMAGVVRIQSKYQNTNPLIIRDTNNSDNGYSLNTELSYDQERSKFTIDAIRRLFPSGNGNLTESTKANLKYSYKITEYISAGITLTGGSIQSVDNRFGNNRDFALAKIKLGYQFARDWNISGKITYRWQDQKNNSDAAHSSSIGMSIVYKPQKVVWSR